MDLESALAGAVKAVREAPALAAAARAAAEAAEAAKVRHEPGVGARRPWWRACNPLGWCACCLRPLAWRKRTLKRAACVLWGGLLLYGLLLFFLAGVPTNLHQGSEPCCNASAVAPGDELGASPLTADPKEACAWDMWDTVNECCCNASLWAARNKSVPGSGWP